MNEHLNKNFCKHHHQHGPLPAYNFILQHEGANTKYPCRSTTHTRTHTRYTVIIIESVFPNNQYGY